MAYRAQKQLDAAVQYMKDNPGATAEETATKYGVRVSDISYLQRAQESAEKRAQQGSGSTSRNAETVYVNAQGTPVYASGSRIGDTEIPRGATAVYGRVPSQPVIETSGGRTTYTTSDLYGPTKAAAEEKKKILTQPLSFGIAQRIESDLNVQQAASRESLRPGSTFNVQYKAQQQPERPQPKSVKEKIVSYIDTTLSKLDTQTRTESFTPTVQANIPDKQRLFYQGIAGPQPRQGVQTQSLKALGIGLATDALLLARFSLTPFQSTKATVKGVFSAAINPKGTFEQVTQDVKSRNPFYYAGRGISLFVTGKIIGTAAKPLASRVGWRSALNPPKNTPITVQGEAYTGLPTQSTAIMEQHTLNVNTEFLEARNLPGTKSGIAIKERIPSIGVVTQRGEGFRDFTIIEQDTGRSFSTVQRKTLTGTYTIRSATLESGETFIKIFKGDKAIKAFKTQRKPTSLFPVDQTSITQVFERQPFEINGQLTAPQSRIFRTEARTNVEEFNLPTSYKGSVTQTTTTTYKRFATITNPEFSTYSTIVYSPSGQRFRIPRYSIQTPTFLKFSKTFGPKRTDFIRETSVETGYGLGTIEEFKVAPNYKSVQFGGQQTVVSGQYRIPSYLATQKDTFSKLLKSKRAEATLPSLERRTIVQSIPEYEFQTRKASLQFQPSETKITMKAETIPTYKVNAINKNDVIPKSKSISLSRTFNKVQNKIKTETKIEPVAKTRSVTRLRSVARARTVSKTVVDTKSITNTLQRITTRIQTPQTGRPTLFRSPPTTPPPRTLLTPFILRRPTPIVRQSRPLRNPVQRAYIPTLYSASLNIHGNPTRLGIKSGLGIRPITRRRVF